MYAPDGEKAMLKKAMTEVEDDLRVSLSEVCLFLSLARHPDSADPPDRWLTWGKLRR